MLRKVHIQGFNSLADVEFELGQINVFVGANGSGKTAVLEALGVLSAAVAGRVDDSNLMDCGVRLGTPALNKTALTGADRIRRFITLEATSELADGSGLPVREVLDNPIRANKPVWSFHCRPAGPARGRTG